MDYAHNCKPPALAWLTAGVAPDDRYGSDGEDIDLMHVEEAEEVAPGQEEDDEAEEGGIEAVMKARKRGRRKESELDMQTAVDDLITLVGGVVVGQRGRDDTHVLVYW